MDDRPSTELQSQRTAAPFLSTPRLSVVIVNYRHWDETAALVRQLSAADCIRRGAAEIIVIDNHSPWQPVAEQLCCAPQVSLRRWQRNRGFATAVNEGCRLSRGAWHLLLNPDMSVPDGFLDKTLALADELSADEPRTGIVGFQLRDSDGAPQLSTGPYPTLASTLLRRVLPRSSRKYQAVRGQERQPVPWVTGCCLLLRSECWRDLAGLDERFFLYYEDVDLCRRARQFGWDVCYEPNLAIMHHQPLHKRSVPPALYVITRHALLTYAAKHWPRWQLRVLAKIVRMETWARRVGAWWRGDAAQADRCRQLSAFTKAMVARDEPSARQNLEATLQDWDVRGGPDS